MAAGAIGQDQLQDWLGNRIKARKAIILLDTCQSGAVVAGHQRSRVDVPTSEAAVGRLHEPIGRPVLSAAAAGQDAIEGVIDAAGEKHGVFTWAVLDALRNGDSNSNGLIELSELVAHVQTTVPKIAAKGGGRERAVTSEPVSDRQSARFGSRGEDFVVAAVLKGGLGSVAAVTKHQESWVRWLKVSQGRWPQSPRVDQAFKFTSLRKGRRRAHWRPWPRWKRSMAMS